MRFSGYLLRYLKFQWQSRGGDEFVTELWSRSADTQSPSLLNRFKGCFEHVNAENSANLESFFTFAAIFCGLFSSSPFYIK